MTSPVNDMHKTECGSRWPVVQPFPSRISHSQHHTHSTRSNAERTSQTCPRCLPYYTILVITAQTQDTNSRWHTSKHSFLHLHPFYQTPTSITDYTKMYGSKHKLWQHHLVLLAELEIHRNNYLKVSNQPPYRPSRPLT